MCGRFVVTAAASDLVTLFDVDLAADDLPGPSWNVAPTSRVAVLIDTIPKGSSEHAEPVRRLESARWGLVPPWAKDVAIGVSAFNARIETAAEKPIFANAVKRRRAIIPAAGYYEWHTVDGVKTPHYIHVPEGQLLLFAALYEWWRNPAESADPSSPWLLSTSILTREAVGELAAIHDRMPVFLDPSLIDEWLDPSSIGDTELLDEISYGAESLAGSLEHHVVGSAVGNVRNNAPELIAAV